VRGRRLRRLPRSLIVIVAAGVSLRAACAVYLARTPVGLHDPVFYRLLGDVIANGNGYRYPAPFNGPGIGFAPTAYYPPAYPTVLAAARWINLHSPLPDAMTATVVAVNLVAAAAGIVLVYAIASRMADHKTALVAAAIVALWPNLILHTATTLSETVFIAVMLLALWLTLKVPRRGASWGWLLAVGVTIGVATLVRPVALPLLGAAAVAWLVARFGWRDTMTRTGIAALGCAAALAPWIARNADAMGSPVLTTNSGDNLCMSRQPGATGAFQLTAYCNADVAGLHRPESEIRKNDDNQHKAATFVREHPGTEARLWFSRLRYGFGNDADGVRAVESYDEDRFLPDWLRTSLNWVANLWFAVVGGVALISLWWWLRRREVGGWLLFASIIGVGVIPIVVFFGDPRFHVPIDPLLAILAAGLLTGWVRHARA
jgi:4-amino-4-deoxy-L-arabinose transferase-like glycosyltransferase